MVASLAVHAAAVSLSVPAPRVSLFEPPVLEVYLREVVPPAAVSPEPATLAPAPLAPETPVRPARVKREAVPRARKSEPLVSSPAGNVEEERTQAPAPQVEVVLLAPPPLPSLPPATRAPAPGASPAELLFGYGHTISRALEPYKEYPRIAQMRGWQGSVTMRLRVAPSGRLIDAEVHASSGHEVLDRQALAMASKPERFPAPPEGLRDRELAVLVPVVFRLER
jgi:periplasmic protein TonB